MNYRNAKLLKLADGALCHQCHHMIDNDKSLDKHDRIAAWEEAHRKTIGWLFTNNHLEIK